MPLVTAEIFPFHRQNQTFRESVAMYVAELWCLAPVISICSDAAGNLIRTVSTSVLTIHSKNLENKLEYVYGYMPTILCSIIKGLPALPEVFSHDFSVHTIMTKMNIV